MKSLEEEIRSEMIMSVRALARVRILVRIQKPVLNQICAQVWVQIRDRIRDPIYHALLTDPRGRRP